MTKLIASLAALAMVGVALPALADCLGHQQTVQSTPLITSDAATSVPMTPAPSPTKTKAGS